ncbi:unnamed protein product [Orchesella dallaii]|uniref:Uncharacterized protein n=1 Tax=Orchesella dallaii TaxID=48710 RepID=A0ABP1S089_9HEXA
MGFAIVLICLVSNCIIGAFGHKFQTSQQPLVKDKTLKWVSASDAFFSHLDPAGYEDNTVSFVARAQIAGSWIPGKAISWLGVTYLAYVPLDGEEITEIPNFQVLLAPPGTTSWVEAHDSVIPSLPVFGGNDPNTGESTYICRGANINGTNLIPGKLILSQGTCYLPHYVEFPVTKYEVLVVNAYGESIGV